MKTKNKIDINNKKCKHQWLVDKQKNFAYYEKCLICIKDNKKYTKEEYIKSLNHYENKKQVCKIS